MPGDSDEAGWIRNVIATGLMILRAKGHNYQLELPDVHFGGEGTAIISSWQQRARKPAARPARPAFLVSEDAGFITGRVIYKTGGQHQPIRRAG